MYKKSAEIKKSATFTKPTIILASIILFGAIGLYFIRGMLDLGETYQADFQVAEAAARPVDTFVVAEETVEESINLLGELYAYENARLSFKIPGYVEELFFQPGDPVEAGQALAKLNETDFDLAVRRADAELQQARARLGLAVGDGREPDPHSTSAVTRARAEQEEAERRLQRIRELRDRNSASQSELESAETTFLVAKHTYQEAIETALERIATVNMREAELEQARQNLDYAVLRAPFDGVIREKLTGPGSYLEEGDPVYSLVRTDMLRLRVEIPERDVYRVSPGQRLRFRFAGQDEIHSAELTRLLPQLEESTRVLIGEVDIENTATWRPGLFVRAELIVAEEVPAIMVPVEAVTSFVGIHRVFVVEDGLAKAREVELGRTIGEHIIITQGLEPNETVIMNPGEIRSGDSVEISSER